MKKKFLLKLIVAMITVTALLTGCGEQEAENKEENVQVSEEREVQETYGRNSDENLTEEENERIKQEGSSSSADNNGSSAEKVIYETAYDVFESNEYQDFYYSIVYEDNSIDELTKRIFMDDIEQMVKDMETLGTLNEFRKFTSLEDFYTFFDEMYAPYGLDRAHRDETNKEAQNKIVEMGGLPLDDAVTFETNESDDSWLEDCVYTIGDTTTINPKDIGGLVDEEITLLHVTATTSTGESIDAGYFSIPKGLDWNVPEKGTVYNYSQYVDLWLSYEEAVNKMR